MRVGQGPTTSREGSVEPLKDFRREREDPSEFIFSLEHPVLGGMHWKRKLEVRRPRERGMFWCREKIMGIRVQREDRVKDEPQFWEEGMAFMGKENTGGRVDWAGEENRLVMVLLTCP